MKAMRIECTNGLTITKEDYIKAVRIGNRLAEMDGKTGWTAKHKVHRSKKAYNRKDKGWKGWN